MIIERSALREEILLLAEPFNRLVLNRNSRSLGNGVLSIRSSDFSNPEYLSALFRAYAPIALNRLPTPMIYVPLNPEYGTVLALGP